MECSGSLNPSKLHQYEHLSSFPPSAALATIFWSVYHVCGIRSQILTDYIFGRTVNIILRQDYIGTAAISMLFEN